MKLPPFISTLSFGLETVPRVAPRLIAASTVISENGKLWICTQNDVLLKLSSLTGHEPSYRCKTTKCLSKAHGSPWRTFSASASSSKSISKMLSPAMLTSKFHFGHHIGLKVLAIASMLSVLLVKNFAANTNSITFLSFDRSHFVPSTLDSDIFFHCWLRSSMVP